MAIDINIPSQVAQTITNGVTGTAPSQDAVYDALQLKENAANKGVANGYAPLNASTKIDSSYLPSYVDDVIEVANYAALPVIGETGKIYITLDTNLLFRWGGTVYVQVGGQDPVWGGIVGTLSNQTDLQNALDAKVPYTGATTNVNLGEWQLSAGQITFDQTPTGTAGVGVMRWNNTDGTVNLGLLGGQSTLKIGQETIARVVNGTGVNLLRSQYKVVKVTSAQGQRLQVNLAQANNDNNSVDTIGIVSENINNNQEGYIKILGQLEEINTTGSLQGETWADGDVLYLSPTTAGAITNIKPLATAGHIVVLGYVEYSHINHGKIFVKILNGWEIDELHNVWINPSTQANNDLLVYNSTSQLWENKTVVSALGYTPANQTININTSSPLTGGGDLSANRTLSINDAAADGTTKGAATFSANDFNSSSGVISIDYTNAQSASSSNKGFLTSTDWSTFNGKQDFLVSSTNIKTIEGQSILGSGNIDLTKSDVGLSNVDNTSDINKPISTATQTALNLKQDTLVSATNIKTVNSSSLLGSGNLSVGTVTNVSALTLGTTGTDLSSTVANGTTTPVITLNVPTASATNRGVLSSTDWTTFNNKAEINPRVQTITSAATVTPTNLNDLVIITAQAAALTIANPTGTMVEGQALMIRIKDNGTARSISFGTNYRAIGIILPTTTVISKTLYLGCIWNSTDNKFDIIGLNQEA